MNTSSTLTIDEQQLKNAGLPWFSNYNSNRPIFAKLLEVTRSHSPVRRHEFLKRAAAVVKAHGYRADEPVGYPVYDATKVDCGQLGLAHPRQFTMRTLVERCIAAMMSKIDFEAGEGSYGPDPGQMVERLERMRNETIDLLATVRDRGAVGSLARNIIRAEDLIAKIEDHGADGDHAVLAAEVKIALNVALDTLNRIRRDRGLVEQNPSVH